MRYSALRLSLLLPLCLALLPVAFYVGYFGAGGGILVMTVLAMFGVGHGGAAFVDGKTFDQVTSSAGIAIKSVAPRNGHIPVDEILAESAPQPQSGYAKRLVLIIQGGIERAEARFRNSPWNTTLSTVFDLAIHGGTDALGEKAIRQGVQ